MTSPANSAVQNLLPVQAYFDAQDNFVTFIGQGKPFTAIIAPDQSGLNITNSTINSTTIGLTTPAAGAFTSFSTNTGTVATQPVGATDIVNLLALQSYAAGISWKQPCAVGTLGPITLSGLQTIDGYTTLAGDRVLVKDQANAAFNGIYLASATAWTRSLDADQWNDFVSAISFIEYGTQAGGAWFCTAVPGGTLGVTPLNWSQFTTSATYSAGTGLTLTGSVFSITNTGVPASTYGSATATPVFAVNAQGQITSVTNTTITPAIGSITGLGTGVATFLQTPTSANLAAAVSDETGSGALVFATSPTLVTPALGTPASGDFSTGTFTWPTFNQNTTGYAAGLAGGAAGSVPYQSAANTTTFLAAGSNGQVLTLTAGVPSWATPTTGTVTSIATAGTVNGLTLTGGPITGTGTITLGGTLDLSAPPAIGGTTANTIRGTTVTATTSFIGTNFDASGSGGGSLRTNTGNACLQWGGGGGTNVTIDGAINMNGANSAVSLAPTGTGTVTINPATASNMNNVAIGGTTPLAGTFTTLRVNNTISLAGSTGTAGYLMQSNGASAPTWVAQSTITAGSATTATTATNATNVAIIDDTTTATAVYPVWSNGTSGNQALEVSSTKLSFVPSTARLGIGTSGPITTIHANGTSFTNSALLVSNTNTNIGVFGTESTWLGSGTSNNLAISTFGALDMLFGTAGAERMRITSAGGISFGASGTAYGSSGQVLTSNGNAAPTWATLTAGTGVTVSGTTINAVGTTINSQTSGYTLVAADAGKTISITTGGVTIPNAVMAAGNIITIYNNSGSSQTITQGASLTLQWAGQSSSTTGNRTLGLYGIATIVYISSSVAVISGAGLT
jgi:hypothetical protein